MLVALAQRSWKDVEAAVDEALGSPLDRLVTPSWEDHHEAVVRAVCESPEPSVVVAEEGGEVLGFVGYRVHPATAGMSEYGEVEVIAVDPARRGRGVGRALLDHAVQDLRDAGVPVIMLETGGDEGHTPARALYEIGRLPAPADGAVLALWQHGLNPGSAHHAPPERLALSWGRGSGALVLPPDPIAPGQTVEPAASIAAASSREGSGRGLEEVTGFVGDCGGYRPQLQPACECEQSSPHQPECRIRTPSGWDSLT